MADSQTDVTVLLQRWHDGDVDALEQLMPLVYDELRRVAHQYLRHERSDHTLNTTDLVHEAYLNLVNQKETPWQDRIHFFAVASRAIRHVLIDYARKRNRAKRGGGAHRLTLDRVALYTAVPRRSEDHFEELISLDHALSRLEAQDARLCRVVECRYFGGLTVIETAEALNISPATVKRDWTMAKAWLQRELRT